MSQSLDATLRALHAAARDTLPVSPFDEGLDLDAIVQRLMRALDRDGAAIQLSSTHDDLTASRPQGASLVLLTDTDQIPLCNEAAAPGCCMGSFQQLADQEFTLVDVHDGARAHAFRGYRLNDGVVALANGDRPYSAFHEAISERGAAGVLLGPGADPQNTVRRLPPRPFFGQHRPFAFSLDARQYRLTRHMLSTHGQVKVRVTVDLGPTPSDSALVVARWPREATSAGALTLVADLLEGSLWGTQLALRVLNTMEAAQKRALIPLPRRPINIAFVAGQRAAQRYLAEGDASTALILGVHSTPSGDPALLRAIDGRPSSFGDLALEVLARAHTLDPQCSYTPRLLERATHSPTLRLACGDHGPDTVTLASGLTARGSEFPLTAGCAALALDVANFTTRQAPRLLACTQLAAIHRLAEQGAELRRQLPTESANTPTLNHLLWCVDQSLKRALAQEHQRLSSWQRLTEEGVGRPIQLVEAQTALTRVVDGLRDALFAEIRAISPRADGLAIKRRPLTALERRASQLIIHRKEHAPWTTEQLLAKADSADRSWLLLQLEGATRAPPPPATLQWTNGKRSLLEIFQLLHERWPGADLKQQQRLVEILARCDLVRTEERSNIAPVPPA